jgi:hypothetical protein
MYDGGRSPFSMRWPAAFCWGWGLGWAWVALGAGSGPGPAANFRDGDGLGYPYLALSRQRGPVRFRAHGPARFRACLLSSVGQSTALVKRGSSVRIRQGAPRTPPFRRFFPGWRGFSCLGTGTESADLAAALIAFEKSGPRCLAMPVPASSSIDESHPGRLLPQSVRRSWHPDVRQQGGHSPPGAALAFWRSCISPAAVRPAVSARDATQSVRPARSWMAICGSRRSGTATTPMNAPTRPK